MISTAQLIAAEPVTLKHALTLQGAKAVGDAAAAIATTNGANPSIAVVDESGALLYFVRSESGFAAGAKVAIGKAHTAALQRRK